MLFIAKNKYRPIVQEMQYLVFMLIRADFKGRKCMQLSKISGWDQKFSDHDDYLSLIFFFLKL